MTSLNSFSTKRRNRRGTTSPPLVNIHSNPGPKQPKKGRKVAKRSLDRHFGEKEKEKAQELINENASIAEISRQKQIQEDTARRWKRRYIETDLWEQKNPQDVLDTSALVKTKRASLLSGLSHVRSKSAKNSRLKR